MPGDIYSYVFIGAAVLFGIVFVAVITSLIYKMVMKTCRCSFKKNNVKLSLRERRVERREGEGAVAEKTARSVSTFKDEATGKEGMNHTQKLSNASEQEGISRRNVISNTSRVGKTEPLSMSMLPKELCDEATFVVEYDITFLHTEERIIGDDV